MSVVRTEEADELRKLAFEDLGDLFLCGLLAIKASQSSQDEQEVTLGLDDFFASQAIDKAVEGGIKHVSVEVDDPLTRMMKIGLGALFGEGDPLVSSGKRDADIGDYFSERLGNSLRILRDGDSVVKPAIESFAKAGTGRLGVSIFAVRIKHAKLLGSFKDNLVNYVFFQETAYEKLMGVTEMSTPAITIDKQLGFLRKLIDGRSGVTGERRFGFTLKSFNFRRSTLEFEGAGGSALMLAPLSPDTGVKPMLPFLLWVQGELDIEQVRIVTPVYGIDDVNIQYSVHRPAVKNVFGANYCALPPDVRARMAPVEVQAYEAVIRALQANRCFLGRPELERQFSEFAVWAVKAVTYCLEEPTYLKEPAQRWLDVHREDGYKRMEDDFFLPFVYERLRDRFGSIVMKKPERFGGNVDILFGELPVELKVRRGQADALVDTVVDEKYRPTSQAAAYAALTRLGCVLVLDIPLGTPSITNLSACVKVVRRDFPEADQPTSVVVFIFHCNSPRPSSAV